MNETYKKILLGLLSAAIVAASWFLLVKPMREDTKQINKEVKDLTAHYNELLEKEVNRQQYIDDTATYYSMYNEKLSEFPSTLDQEYLIEFVQGIRNNEEITYDVSSQAMEKETAYYSLSGSNSEGSIEEEEASEAKAGLECYKSTMVLSYNGSYEGIKAFMDYVASYPYRMTIDTVTISQDGEDNEIYGGSMTVNVYCIKGEGREEQVDLDLDDIETGVDNLFTGGASTAGVSKFAADNGDSIKSDYDLYVAVNPADSDASGKLVGLKAGGSNVTSSKNESEVMSIKITQDGDTYKVEYGIGAEKQIQTFEPGEDLTLLIQSSDVKDTSDVNGIQLSIDNGTKKTLYVKVAGDETANRVKITKKAGSVIVYK